MSTDTCYIIELESQVVRWKGQSHFWTGNEIGSEMFVLESKNWKVKTFETLEAAETDLALIEDKFRRNGKVTIMGPNPSVLNIIKHYSENIAVAKQTKQRFDRSESTVNALENGA